MYKVIWKANCWPPLICDLNVRKYFLDKQTFRFLCSACSLPHSPHPCHLLFDKSNTMYSCIPYSAYSPSFPMMFRPFCFSTVPWIHPLAVSTTTSTLAEPCLDSTTSALNWSPCLSFSSSSPVHFLWLRVDFLKCKNLIMSSLLLSLFHGFQLLVN